MVKCICTDKNAALHYLQYMCKKQIDVHVYGEKQAKNIIRLIEKYCAFHTCHGQAICSIYV